MWKDFGKMAKATKSLGDPAILLQHALTQGNQRGFWSYWIFEFRYADASLQNSLLSHFQTWRAFATAKRSAKSLGEELIRK